MNWSVWHEKNAVRYEYRNALNADLPDLDLGDPVGMTLRRGDVLFLHNLCIHSGSKNVSNRATICAEYEMVTRIFRILFTQGDCGIIPLLGKTSSRFLQLQDAKTLAATFLPLPTYP